MKRNYPRGGAVAFVSLSAILLAVSLASSSWITFCSPDPFLLHEQSLCVNVGLNEVSVDGSGIRNVIKAHKVTWMIVVLGASLLCSVVGGVFHVMAACAGNDAYGGKSSSASRTHRAAVLLTFAVLLGAGAMAAYTALSAAEMELLGSTTRTMSLRSFEADADRRKRDVEHLFPSYNDREFGNQQQPDNDRSTTEQSTLDNLDSDFVDIFDPSHDQEPIGEQFSTRHPSDDQPDEDIPSMLQFEYGYSFILGWTSVVANIIALCLTIQAQKWVLNSHYVGYPVNF